MAKTTAVAQPSNARSAQFAEWVNAMQLEADLPGNESFDPSEILGAILAAESFDDAVDLQNSSLESGKNLVGWAHRINDFVLVKSDDKYSENERSLGVYARVFATDIENGEEKTYGVGASNVLAILWQARQFDRIPGDFMLHSRATRSGDLLSLRPVGKRTIKGEAVKTEAAS